jgi:hypothetical protein
MNLVLTERKPVGDHRVWVPFEPNQQFDPTGGTR